MSLTLPAVCSYMRECKVGWQAARMRGADGVKHRRWYAAEYWKMRRCLAAYANDEIEG
ncbi:hypothetical protein QEH52_01645 [Coraliomargarita sp. SDUM461003]|uniref:Uncharacterized protein n=2 Tax=Thalassobacterium maritimum TaxID=3041265 RepID=A0ABU1ASS5_9BACT|nr:hypothetical protein [Coraliomargarita sp. SDUM461003]